VIVIQRREHSLDAANGGGGDAGSGLSRERSAAEVLADRVASALIHHEPGWRLPRRSALARRYGVSAAEMEAAIEELAARHLLRRLPDGQVYRASPADYLIRLEGLPDLRATIDPMGAPIDCASRHTSQRRVPEDIGGALGLAPGDPVLVVRCLWNAGSDPVAYSATYLPERYSFLAEDPPALADVLRPPMLRPPMLGPPMLGPPMLGPPGLNAAVPAQHGPAPRDGQAAASPGRPAGLFVELQPPAPSVARSLRLAAGQPAVSVTVRFDDPAAEAPMALATAVLRADMFRVVVESAQGAVAGAAAAVTGGVWTHTAEGWEP
jgi:hypothetical protein